MKPSQLAFASALSEDPNTESAIAAVAEEGLQRLATDPDLAFVFFSSDHVSAADRIARQLSEKLGTTCILGCSGESVVGVSREVEASPAISLWLAHLPDTEVVPARLEFARTPDGGTIVGWPDRLSRPWPQDASLLLLGDPFTFPADLLLENANEEHPGIPIVGGMASAAQEPGGNRLLLGQETFNDGAVGVWIAGDVRLRTVVSQGCRPIGDHFVVTKAERNVVQQLGGLPAYRRLEEVYATLATSEQRMLQRGLHLGRVVSEYQDRFEQGDFLVRNVVGVDPEEGYVAIGDYVRVGQTVQFHIRDAETADAEFRHYLRGRPKIAPPKHPQVPCCSHATVVVRGSSRNPTTMPKRFKTRSRRYLWRVSSRLVNWGRLAEKTLCTVSPPAPPSLNQREDREERVESRE